ncbi:MAG TPA: hypothetical protein VEZ42_14305 [Pseudonocardia sp.]|nr:hypothetical protein [Pseudonocardia sp.]
MGVTGPADGGPAADRVRAALEKRATAIRALRRLQPTSSIRRLTAARSALGPVPDGPAADPGAVGRTNLAHLRTCLDLEIALLVAVRDAQLGHAGSLHGTLVAHHGTRQRCEVALRGLPADVRSFGSHPSLAAVSPLVFALPFAALADYLGSALPPLVACPHGLLGADGCCRTPPCPPG